MIRLGIVSHHGGKPAGAEHALMLLLDQTRADVEPLFFLFEDGEFSRLVRERYGNATVVSMSARVASSTRAGLRWNALPDALELSRRLATELRRADVDVVLTNTMKAHVVGSIAARMSGTPCVNYMHDVLAGASRNVMRKTSLAFADARLACSIAVAENLNLPRTTIVHPPIDLGVYGNLPPRREARRALGLPDDDLPVVGLVGRILRWKGQDRFIRIAARVLRSVDAHFAIIGGSIFGGDADYPDELRAQIAELRLEHRIHFVPWQEDLTQVYAAIDVGCNCSVREPFGRTTIEALAAGDPAVCFDDAGVCEIFENDAGARAVPAGNEAAFAEAVIALLSDPATMARAQASARDVAARLDVSHVAQRFLSALEAVDATTRRLAGEAVASAGGVKP
jgi:glycosyltransferase involved in cell wall biosynthesis